MLPVVVGGLVFLQQKIMQNCTAGVASTGAYYFLHAQQVLFDTS
jgi:hypothetical protein